jgi:pyridoxamine 5'-phosphate oxidase
MIDFAVLDLEAFRDAALGLLSEGVKNPRHPLHALSLATLAENGAPRLRSVVPRGFDAAARNLTVHADIRSAKLNELRHDPRASVLGWDADARVQVRLEGDCTLHHQDAAARRVWEALRPVSREIYRIGPDSGTVVLAEAEIEPRRFDAAAAFGNFALIIFKYNTMDALFLGKERHRRMRCDWESGKARLAWVVP